MLFALVIKLLRDLRWPLLVTAVLLGGFECLWVKITQRTTTQLAPLFATLAARAGIYQEEIEKILFRDSGKIMQTLAGGESIRFERAMDTLSVGYVHPVLQTIFCIWAIGRAAGAIAGEIDRGTMELLLAQPLARWKLVLAHLIVDAITIPVLCLCLWAGTWAGLQLVGQPFEVPQEQFDAIRARFPLFKVVVDPALLAVDARRIGPALPNIGLFVFALSGLTMALSSAGRFRNRVVGAAVLGALVMFLVNTVGQLWELVAPLRPFTAFYYYQAQQAILSGSTNVALAGGRVSTNGVLLTVGLAGYALATLIFARRDIPAPL